MIRITQLKLPIEHKKQELYEKTAKLLRVAPSEIKQLKIVKQSVDARKKEQILFIYTVDVEVAKEQQILKKVKNNQVSQVKEVPYQFPSGGEEPLKHPPVIIGSGPAGLFCGLMLAQAGYHPILLERGQDVEQRQKDVEWFWNTGILNTRSNVQFGEGGAGTFSDGKLNTLVKDPLKRNQKVLEILVEHGADPEILYVNKPHIGTDVLSKVVKNIREHIIDLGGQVFFESQVTDMTIKGGRITALEINGDQPEKRKVLEAEAVVLAVGHSARDTFAMLLKRGVPMEKKAFAVGLRIQHPQAMINQSQYSMAHSDILGPASYKVTHQTSLQRGVYSFCMCPGGYVVNASSEEKRLAVNGMSNHDRGSRNANSALIVTVTPADFEGDSPLAGVEYQRKLESLAYEYGHGRIPVQLYGDFKAGLETKQLGEVDAEFKGAYQFANLKEMLPNYLSQSIIEGVEHFEGMIHGFSRYDSILAGVESRTSSPVRIHRDERFESQITGLYPCGEGAGYAGGITSAAMDGLKVAEAIGRRYAFQG